jgi:hypothetical protein
MPLKAYGIENTLMSTWTVEYAEEFEPEYLELVVDVRVELTAQAKMIEKFGPTLGRPRVDTLNGSKHKNMKELRFDAAGGVWRVAFAFDPRQRAILLVAGDKGGRGKRFYRQLIAKADRRYDAHLEWVKERKGK